LGSGLGLGVRVWLIELKKVTHPADESGAQKLAIAAVAAEHVVDAERAAVSYSQAAGIPGLEPGGGKLLTVWLANVAQMASVMPGAVSDVRTAAMLELHAA
jgi:hypothetical protein